MEGPARNKSAGTKGWASFRQLLAQLGEDRVRMLTQRLFLRPRSDELKVVLDFRVANDTKYIVLNWQHVSDAQKTGLPGKCDVSEMAQQFVDFAFAVRVVEPVVVLEFGVLNRVERALNLFVFRESLEAFGHKGGPNLRVGPPRLIEREQQPDCGERCTRCGDDQ